MNPITRDELRNAIKQMKTAFEMVEALGNFGLDKIIDIATFVYESGNIPCEMIASVFIALPKMPGTKDCKAYRTISL